MKKVIGIVLALATGPAWAGGGHNGPCTKYEVGIKVPVCNTLNDHSRCVAKQVYEDNKATLIFGSCHNPNDPCGNGKCEDGETAASCPIDCGGTGESACCTNSMGGGYTVSTCAECKKGSLTVKCQEDSHADANLGCTPNGCEDARAPEAVDAVTAPHVPGQLDIEPPTCPVVSGVSCCIYLDAILGFVTTTVDGGCDSDPCSPKLPGGQPFDSCESRAYSSGDGRTCVPSN